jgi:hypothetical protein
MQPKFLETPVFTKEYRIIGSLVLALQIFENRTDYVFVNSGVTNVPKRKRAPSFSVGLWLSLFISELPYF